MEQNQALVIVDGLFLSFFIVRLFLLIEAALTQSASFFVFAAMTLTILIILMIVIQPSKEDRSQYSTINTKFAIILAIIFSSSYYREW